MKAYTSIIMPPTVWPCLFHPPHFWRPITGNNHPGRNSQKNPGIMGLVRLGSCSKPTPKARARPPAKPTPTPSCHNGRDKFGRARRAPSFKLLLLVASVRSSSRAVRSPGRRKHHSRTASSWRSITASPARNQAAYNG